MPFLQYGPYVAIDFETSAHSGPCACAIGMARMENLEIADTYYALIRPPSNRVCFTHIHGLTWEILKDQPDFPDLWPEIRRFMTGARYLIAHNARFDSSVLERCCNANDISMPAIPFLCTLQGARRGLRLRNNGLAALSNYFGIKLDHHNAASDAKACGLIHSELIKLGITDSQMLLSRRKTTTKVV